MVGYPSSRIIKLEPVTQAYLDMVMYSILLYFTIIRMFIKKVTKTALIRTCVISFLLAYLIICNFMIILSGAERGATQQVVSFLILMFFIRSLRESWKRISFVVMDSVAIMVIIISYILFTSLLGFTLFNDTAYNDPAGYFLSIP
mmetsp:Transcript_2851/g.4442  ORF Transcript_2851/g.4442 Transcript_2851/m.4442 type:complete len:145 (-) Transcript_2851:81-515(-)